MFNPMTDAICIPSLLVEGLYWNVGVVNRQNNHMLVYAKHGTMFGNQFIDPDEFTVDNLIMWDIEEPFTQDNVIASFEMVIQYLADSGKITDDRPTKLEINLNEG